MLRFVRRRHSGVLLLEALLGIALFTIFVVAISLVIMTGQQTTSGGGNRARAVFLTEQVQEAVRTLRDASFTNIQAPAIAYTTPYGVRLDGSTGKWALYGTQTTWTGGYITSVMFTKLAADWVRSTVTTRWQTQLTRSGSVVSVREFADWREGGTVGDWSAVALDRSYVPGGSPLFNHAAVSDRYLFVTSDAGTLYVFDVSGAGGSSPVTTVNVGSPLTDIAVWNNQLYVLAQDPSAEIRVFSLASPATLSMASQLTTFNLTGSLTPAYLALNASNMYVATNNTTAGTGAVFSFNLTTASPYLTQHSRLATTAEIRGISVYATGAYLALNSGTSEGRMVNITNPAVLSFAGNVTYDLTGTQVGRSIFVTGTAALIGRQKGVTDDLSQVDTRFGGGSPPPAVLTHAGSGTILGIALDSLGCYAFLAADGSTKALQVINTHSTALPEITSYNTSSPARGVFYDPFHDRVYILTDTTFYMLKPSSATGPCI